MQVCSHAGERQACLFPALQPASPPVGQPKGRRRGLACAPAHPGPPSSQATPECDDDVGLVHVRVPSGMCP